MGVAKMLSGGGYQFSGLGTSFPREQLENLITNLCVNGWRLFLLISLVYSGFKNIVARIWRL
jgi:hypothetical protein